MRLATPVKAFGVVARFEKRHHTAPMPSGAEERRQSKPWLLRHRCVKTSGASRTCGHSATTLWQSDMRHVELLRVTGHAGARRLVKNFPNC